MRRERGATFMFQKLTLILGAKRHAAAQSIHSLMDFAPLVLDFLDGGE